MKNYKVVFTFAFVFFSFILGTSYALSKSPSDSLRAVLISVDGFRPEFYLSNKYSMPHLQNLIKNGAYADGAVPVFPSVTYPNHTSLITGAPPAVHGIVSNTVFTWEKGPQRAWYWEAEHIKSQTILDAAKEKGLTTSAIRWPVTLFGKADYLVPEIFGMSGYYEGDGWELTKKYTNRKLMDELLVGVEQQGYKNEEEMDHWVSSASQYILQKYQPHVMAIHLANVDHVEHGAGREGDEIQHAVKDADANIGKILEGMDLSKTCVFVAGDHGFYDVSQKIALNVLFAQAGWIRLDEKNNVVSWDVVSHASGGQAAIYTKKPTLVPQIEKLLRSNTSLGFRIITKKQLIKLGSYPEAVLAVTANEGFTMSGEVSGAVVSSSGGLKGQHGALADDPKLHTGLVVAGCGILPGQKLGIVSNLSIAPTIAKYLGLELKGATGQPLKLKRQ